MPSETLTRSPLSFGAWNPPSWRFTHEPHSPLRLSTVTALTPVIILGLRLHLSPLDYKGDSAWRCCHPWEYVRGPSGPNGRPLVSMDNPEPTGKVGESRARGLGGAQCRQQRGMCVEVGGGHKWMMASLTLSTPAASHIGSHVFTVSPARQDAICLWGKLAALSAQEVMRMLPSSIA